MDSDQLRHVFQVLETCELIISQIQFPQTGHVPQTFQSREFVLSKLKDFKLGMSFKIIKRVDLVSIEIQVPQILQIDTTYRRDLISLQVNLLQIGECIRHRQEFRITNEVIFQVQESNELQFFQVADIRYLIEAEVNDTQMRVGINRLCYLLEALIADCELCEGVVCGVHDEGELW